MTTKTEINAAVSGTIYAKFVFGIYSLRPETCTNASLFNTGI